MKTLVAEFISLDGVVQSAWGANEDMDGAFSHGGWSMKYFDPAVIGWHVFRDCRAKRRLLQGRRTYQTSARRLAQSLGDPFSDWINRVQKYVVSNSLTENVVAWNPTTIIRGDDFERKVRNCASNRAATYTSTVARRWSDRCSPPDLVDELLLTIEPIILGGGKTIFPTTERRSRSRWCPQLKPAPARKCADMCVTGSLLSRAGLQALAAVEATRFGRRDVLFI